MKPAELDGRSLREQLERVLASPGFARNERLCRFLRFVFERHLEGRDQEIKESLIAIEVFGRKPDYDPKQYSIVRTEAGRLRARLAEYYAGEGRGDPVIIELPKGGYAPVFHQHEAPRDTIAPDRDRQAPRLGTQLWLMIALAGLAVALAAMGWWWVQHKSALIPIAVLPLEDLSRDPANDYFADGLTDEIIRNLSIIEGLAVRSQTSSFALKGKPNVREAGQQLQADYILEGSVLRSGQQLRINAQLVRVRDDFPVWSGRYDRELTDVLAIQDDISRGIVNGLRLKLGAGRRRYETSVEAYDLYLRARALQTRPGPSGKKGSIGPFEQAIAKDPTFAPAYAGLAWDYAVLSGDDRPDLANDLPKMRVSVEKALQLDPLLAEAHAALAVSYARDAQWDRSEKSFRRALELDPNNSTTYGLFAMHLLLPLGRIEEAVQRVRAAEKRDPLSPDVQFRLTYALLSAGRFEEAAAHCQKSPEMRSCLARARLGQGRVEEAIPILEAAFKEGVASAGDLGYAYARASRREEAEKLAADAGPVGQARIFAGLGDKDRAFEALDRAIPSGPVRIGRDLTWPEFTPLRGDLRVKGLRKKVGLPE